MILTKDPNDGVTDDTALLQSALNASLDVGLIGRFRITAPLIGRTNQVIAGVTPELSQIINDSSSGDTFTFGEAGGAAGAVKVGGLWLKRDYVFNNGTTYVPGVSNDILNKNPAASHIHTKNGQNVRISDCWFSGMGYGIDFLDTTIMWVERCLFNGMWDTNVAGLQDSTAAIRSRASLPGNRSGILHVCNNHIGGYAAGAPVNVTTGNVTVSHALNAGMKYGVMIESCERFTIKDNYIGGQSVNNVLVAANALCAHGTIHDNMLDGAGEYCIQVYATQAMYYMNFLSIHDNTSVGYGIEQGFLWVRDFDNQLAATYLNVHDNIGQFYLKAPIRLENCRGVKLKNNRMAAGNSDNATNGDPYIEAGCVVAANATHVEAEGNTWGGGINDPDGPCNQRWGIFFYTPTNNSASLERATNLGHAGGSVVGGLSQSYP